MLLFQFHSGAISSFTCNSHFSKSFYFNSTLVRLVAKIDAALVKRKKISIPLWCDQQSNIGSLFASSRIKFQFHSGAISSDVSLGDAPITMISIPLWCDQQLHGNGFFDLLRHFNSTLVRLVDLTATVNHYGAILFQFHSGAISSAGFESFTSWFD